MIHGVNSIALQGDETIARKYVRQTEKLMDALRARMGSSGATVASTQLRFDDAIAYVVVGPGIARGVITAGYVDYAVDPAMPAPPESIPDFASGVVMTGWLRGEGEAQLCESFVPTPESAAMLGMPEGIQLSRRFAVKPSLSVEARYPPHTGPLALSQYQRVKPTLYSGRMRQVVQFIAGFGRRSPQSIYDLAEPKLLPEIGASPPLGMDFERQVVEAGRQVQYDWGYTRTHGITVASDGTWWLVEIGMQGVKAMPLPCNELARRPEFLEKLEALGDDEALYALEQLDGNWPTGMAFPRFEAEEMARSGGFIVQLAEHDAMTAVYSRSSYSSPMGWAFNDSGTEAHVTGYWTHADGIQRGSWFAARISIGRSAPIDPPPEAAAIQARITGAFATAADKRAAYPWALRKAERLTRMQASNVLDTGTAQQLWDALLAQQCPPLATAAAQVRLMDEGLLYQRGQFQRHIQFPEPMFGYCISHDMRPTPSTRDLGSRRCDTVMMVFFDGDDLQTVRYYYEPSTRPVPEQSDYEDCMYVGSWSRSAAIPDYGCPPMMYSNQFDDREDHGAQTEDETITSVDMGYTRTVVFDDLHAYYLGYLVRTKTFHRTTVRRTVSGAFVRASVRVPFWDRCAYYYTVSRGLNTEIVTTTVGRNDLNDPNSYETWRNVRGWTTFRDDPPPSIPISEHPAGCGPVLVRTVNIPMYGAYPCSEFADSGPWATPCTNAEALVFGFTPPIPPSSTVVTQPNETSRTWLVSTAAAPLMVAQHLNLPIVLGFSPGAIERWFLTSPDPVTNSTQYISTTCSVLGSDVSLQYSTEMNPPVGSSAIHGRRWHPDMDNKAITYVGVIGG